MNHIRSDPGGLPQRGALPITITLFVTDANGCPAPQVSVSVPIRTIAAPPITLATPDICRYGTDTASVPPGYANYYWSINNDYLYRRVGTDSITFHARGMPYGS